MLELPSTLAKCSTYFRHHTQGRSHKIHLCFRFAIYRWALHYLSTCDSISCSYGWTSKTGRLWPLLFPCTLLCIPQRGSRCCPVGLDRLCPLPRHTLGMSKKAKLLLLNLKTQHCIVGQLIWSLNGKNNISTHEKLQAMKGAKVRNWTKVPVSFSFLPRLPRLDPSLSKSNIYKLHCDLSFVSRQFGHLSCR